MRIAVVSFLSLFLAGAAPGGDAGFSGEALSPPEEVERIDADVRTLLGKMSQRLESDLQASTAPAPSPGAAVSVAPPAKRAGTLDSRMACVTARNGVLDCRVLAER